jgi:hypothetical protein
MNCNAGIIQWGIQTGNKTVRDLGIFMYVNEARATEQYWFDVDEAVFPANYPHNAVGMVWSNGGAYSTWFSSDVAQIHGINILPIAAGSLYLGRRPDHIVKNVAEGNKGSWQDLFLQYLAFADPEQAAAKYGAGVGAEGGDSKAHATYQIKSLQAAGRLNIEIGASVPSFAVFDKAAAGGAGTTRTYTAYNPDSAPATVVFTDGFTLEVPARTQATKTGQAKPIGILARSRASAKSFQGIRNGLGDANVFRGLASGTALFDMGGRKIGVQGSRGGEGVLRPAGNFQGVFITVPENLPSP